jgi:hypothetical protein
MTTQWRPNCEFFYEDHYRGRDEMDCRLLARNPVRQQWAIGLCRTCPVPRILQANRCPNMILEARVESRFLRRRVTITAFCTKAMREVAEPMVGCGLCHTFRE